MLWTIGSQSEPFHWHRQRWNLTEIPLCVKNSMFSECYCLPVDNNHRTNPVRPNDHRIMNVCSSSDSGERKRRRKRGSLIRAKEFQVEEQNEKTFKNNNSHGQRFGSRMSQGEAPENNSLQPNLHLCWPIGLHYFQCRFEGGRDITWCEGIISFCPTVAPATTMKHLNVHHFNCWPAMEEVRIPPTDRKPVPSPSRAQFIHPSACPPFSPLKHPHFVLFRSSNAPLSPMPAVLG